MLRLNPWLCTIALLVRRPSNFGWTKEQEPDPGSDPYHNVTDAEHWIMRYRNCWQHWLLCWSKLCRGTCLASGVWNDGGCVWSQQQCQLRKQLREQQLCGCFRTAGRDTGSHLQARGYTGRNYAMVLFVFVCWIRRIFFFVTSSYRQIGLCIPGLALPQEKSIFTGLEDSNAEPHGSALIKSAGSEFRI